MAVIVQKFGGTSVANAGKIRQAAQRAVDAKRKGYDVVVVVSARGHKTDELVDLAAEITKTPRPREMDMLLSTGEIPGLIAKDEKEAWLGDITQEFCKNNNVTEPSAIQLYSYFLDRVRDNLHIVLCFSPVGMKFRERARKFPALFNECCIDWFLPWPEEALVSVAETFIKNFKELDTKPETKIELYKHMGSVH